MDINTMIAIKNTLETITTAGSENWAKLLGCIKVLDSNIAKAQEAAKNEKDSKAE